MNIAYWIRTERFTEPNRTEPLKKPEVDIRLNVDFEQTNFTILFTLP